MFSDMSYPDHVICLWSGPRNVSTALMYSFRQRADTRVIDEPLYAHYLNVTGAQHPGREDVLKAQDNDGNNVIHDVIMGTCDRSVLFVKNMAHHLVDIPLGFLECTENVILTREPADMLRSLSHQIPQPTLRDTGFKRQVDLLHQLQTLGQNPAVIDARELLNDPAGILGKLCTHIGIPFSKDMLHWSTGPKPEDGVWAPHWYSSVHTSTSFTAYREKTDPFPESLEPTLKECQPFYETLYARAFKAGA